MSIKRDQKAIVKRIVDQLERLDLDAVLLSTGDAILYATGFGDRKLYRGEPVGSAAAVVTREGKVGLVVSEFDKRAAEQITEDVTIIDYPTWIFIADYAKPNMKKEAHPSPIKAYELALELLPEKQGGAKIAVQRAVIAHDAWVLLADKYGEKNIFDAKELLKEARVIKTPWEIETLRTVAQMDEIVMHKVERDVVPGMTPAEVVQLFNQYAYASAPDVISVSNAHTLGENFTPYVIWPHERLQRGDIIRLDGGPKWRGYNSDLARTFAVGNYAKKEFHELYAHLFAGYEYAMAHIGPGVKFSDIFNGIHEVLKARGFGPYIRGHQGHSIGCGFDGEEAPFIGPEEHRVFEPGMVLNIEMPYYSSKNQTYNIEDTFLITEDGIELFTHASPSLYI